MKAFFFVLALIVIAFSLYKIIRGKFGERTSYYTLEWGILAFTLTCLASYFLGLINLMVLVLGIAGLIAIYIGISCEDEKELAIGTIYCTIGVVLFLIAGYFCVHEGWYLGMSMALSVFSWIFGIHVIECKEIPILSSIMSGGFMFVCLYIIRNYNIDPIQVLIMGGLCGMYIYIVCSEMKKRILLGMFGAMNFIAPFKKLEISPEFLNETS